MKIKFLRVIIRILFLVLILSLNQNHSFSQKPQVGEMFPQWSEGLLDIHHINTGKGESSFFILPDGTTLLVDAGATSTTKPRVTDSKPNDSRTPGDWISRYILHMMQDFNDKSLNYLLLTHFHEDHMGCYSETKTSESGAYKLSGITEVGENIPFDKVIDRGWPYYDWPVKMDNNEMKNYLQFLKWHAEKNGVVVEQFMAGKNDQIILRNDPCKYPNFEIRNIAANGHIWTGLGSNERNHFPNLEDIQEKDYPAENMCCIAFRLSYGKFDYFNGGDIYAGIPGHWQDLETPVALVTGPVDVCVANHHANFDAMGIAFLQAVRPRVHIIMTWLAQQPAISVLRRMLSTETYPGPRDIFATNIMEETKIVVGWAVDSLKSQQGHIVVRVNPGGENYMIYILDDSEENFRIKAIHGPYICE
jgi:hypothetical protein